MKTHEVKWVEPPRVDVTSDLITAAQGSRFLAELLMRRGVSDPQVVRNFFDINTIPPVTPTDLPDLTNAVNRLEHAISKGELIGIWGDFDVDGQTATTILVSGLLRLGAKVLYYIPIRARDSHGVNISSLKSFLDQSDNQIKVLLTCDTGISAHDSVAYAASRGVDTIITDHHTLPPDLPAALAVVNPQRLSDPTHPLFTLSGVGTAYMLVTELFTRFGRSGEQKGDLDLVALGTVADLALLTGENRRLVKQGIEIIRLSPRPAFQAIFELTTINPLHVSEEHLSFILAPRLNALGRLEDANPVVDFFRANDTGKARMLAVHLEGLNNRRKLLCDQVFEAANAQIENDRSLLDAPVLVLSHPKWPAGVIGIVASRLVELYHRPAVLLTAPPGEPARGSARSVEGINITQALASQRALLITFGGHAMAAGLSLDPQRIPDLRRNLQHTIAEMTAAHPLTYELPIDAFLNLSDTNLNLVEFLDNLSPFGPGNPPFIFAVKGVSLKNRTLIGKAKEHCQLMIEDDGGNTYKVLWWQGAALPVPEGKFDLAYHLRANTYGGQRAVQLEYAGARQENHDQSDTITNTQIDITDLRSLDDYTNIQEKVTSDALVWLEGPSVQEIAGKDRNHLYPNAVLVIATIPPGHLELQQVLQSVKPQRIILLALDPYMDEPNVFLKRLTGLVNYIIKERQGRTTYSELAAQTSQREAIVQKGIEWLSARGLFRLARDQNGFLEFIIPGTPRPDDVTSIEKELIFLLRETAAFRAYYKRAQPEQLLT